MQKLRSCKDIILNNPESKSGEYTITQDTKTSISVFCEFSSKSHGYTYLKDYSESQFNVRSICSTTDEVKVVHLRTSGKRYGTVLEELKRYQSNYSLSLQINENKGFNAPLNAPFLGKYIYVGFLPRSIAARRSIQGYRAGSKDWEFNNCDANPNSYIAFFYNNSPLQTHSYHKRCCYNKYMRNWIDVSTRYSLPIPDDYFRFFEMHMGGCGGYVVPNYGTFSHIVGAVPGFRFDVTCSDIHCHHGGSCIIANGRPTCLCSSGFTGSQCKEKIPFSCKDIAISKGPITGEYLIYSRTKQSQPYNVFCEFHQTYGLTFVSNTNATIDANELFEIKSQVVVRHLRNNKQYDSILEQITPYADKPLTVKYNSFAGFRAPLNAKKMGPYLYLGFLDKDTAKAKNTQGYRVNDADQTFVNCDRNPNSYITFYFNPKSNLPDGYYKRCCYTPLMKTWLDVGVPVDPARQLPKSYFLQFEMHFGGCGGYAINGYNTLANIKGAALGMRFEI